MAPADGGLLVQGRDHHLQVEQRAVDELRFAENCSGGIGFPNALRPRKIDEIQLGPTHSVGSVLAGLDRHQEDAVRSGRGLPT